MLIHEEEPMEPIASEVGSSGKFDLRIAIH